jgi:hypothetical protein
LTTDDLNIVRVVWLRQRNRAGRKQKATSGAEPTVRSEGVTAFNKGAEVARRKVIDCCSVDRRE